jgi:hypothetical protein
MADALSFVVSFGGPGDFIIGVFEWLCSDDGKSIAADDLAKLTRWHADKVAAFETQFRAMGTETAYRLGVRDTAIYLHRKCRTQDSIDDEVAAGGPYNRPNQSMSTVRQLGVFRHLVSARSFNKTHPGGSFDAGTFKLFGR